MSLLDQMIDTHHDTNGDGGLVASENHDPGTISVIPGTDAEGGTMAARIAYLENGGFWDEAEYGITREAQVAKLKAANTPEQQEKELEEMRKRAWGRAALAVIKGRVAFAGVGGGWHGLGVNVTRAMTAAEARNLASLNWLVEKLPCYYHDPLTEDEKECGDVFALVRQDTGEKLGTVGARYEVIQNDVATDFLDRVVGEFGGHYETAGAVYGGQKIFLTVRLTRQAFAVNGKDEVVPYAAFTNPHDGSGKAYCFPTSERIVCANTLRIALQGRKDKGIGIRHTGDVRNRVAAARSALGLAVKGFERFRGEAEQMARTKVKIEHFASDVLDAALGVTLADMKKEKDLLAAVTEATEAETELRAKRIDEMVERRAGVIEKILEVHHDPKNGIAGMRGTAWAALNAVTQAADHEVFRYKGDDDKRASRRFEVELTGDADDLKQAAYRTAVAALKA